MRGVALHPVEVGHFLFFRNKGLYFVHQKGFENYSNQSAPARPQDGSRVIPMPFDAFIFSDSTIIRPNKRDDGGVEVSPTFFYCCYCCCCLHYV